MSLNRCLTDKEIATYHIARNKFGMLGDVAVKIAEELATKNEVQAGIDALELAVRTLDKIQKRKMI